MVTSLPPLACASIRELDRRAIEEHGVPSLLLMENAGRACADEAERMLGSLASVRVVVLAGPGNNGGDGFVIARTLFNRGARVQLVFVGTSGRLERASEDVRKNAEFWRHLEQEIHFQPDGPDLGMLPLADAALVVDALLGTGTARELSPPLRAHVEAVNHEARRVLAVDLPTGLDGDSGVELGAVVHAEVTVTFVAPKLGFECGVGPAACGRVVVAEIGIPRPLLLEAAASVD